MSLFGKKSAAAYEPSSDGASAVTEPKPTATAPEVDQPTQAMPAATSGETKADHTETKPVDVKPAESKPTVTKPVETKPVEEPTVAQPKVAEKPAPKATTPTTTPATPAKAAAVTESEKPVPSTEKSHDRSSYSENDAEPTRVISAPDAEAQRLEAERAAERERRRAERDQALGTKRKAVEPEEVAPAPKPKRTTDKFFGSLGLFLLRMVTAFIFATHGAWKIANLAAVEKMLNNTVIPEPHIMSYVLAASEIAIALGLFFGMLTRLAGLGAALVGIGALVFVQWVSNPFKGYMLAKGETELLLGAIGLVFLFLGAGGWSVDAAFRRRRAANKA